MFCICLEIKKESKQGQFCFHADQPVLLVVSVAGQSQLER